MEIIYNNPQIKLQINSGEPWLNGETDLAKWINEIFHPKQVFAVGAQKDFDFVKCFDKETNIHLFEPQKLAFRELLNNEELFNRPNTFFNLMGASNRTGYATYYRWGESVYDHDGKGETDTIFLTTLKNYCRQRDLNHIDFLKIDVEGLEWEVIDGLANVECDFIQFEYGDRYLKAGKTLGDMFSLLKNRYIYHIEPQTLRCVGKPIENYHYANYLASKIKL